MKILIVDDSRIMRRIISGAAETLGYEVIEACNGKEALNVLADESEDIAAITMDINMPEMSGMECLDAIMSDERFSRIPITMVTTESEKQSTLTAIRKGAKHYVTKPFTPEDITTLLMELLGDDDDEFDF